MKKIENPILWSDVPDPDVIRVGDVYYMTSTTMHFTPGCPVMKSKDLVHWEIVNYVYDVLEDSDIMTLQDGKHDYGRGSWASCLRYHNETFYVTFVAYNTNKTYILHTKNIEKGSWERYTLEGIYHDMSLLFDEDGRVYMVYGGGAIKVIELNRQVTGLLPGGLDKTIIPKTDVGGEGGLPAEGAHIYKLKGWYYIFLIAWPPASDTSSGRRIVICYRSRQIDGEYEGRVLLDDDLGFHNMGVAQGGIVDTPEGEWFSLLFQDHGAVGRIPVLVPVTWEEDWPVFGNNGKVPVEITLPLSEDAMFDEESKGFVTSDKGIKGIITSTEGLGGIVTSDEFADDHLGLPWQWNHNPDHRFWSLDERPGWLQLTTGSLCRNLSDARNTLTQRTVGPRCSGEVLLDVKYMKNGDVAGLAALQDEYGLVGVKMEEGQKKLVMRKATSSHTPTYDMDYQTGKPEIEVESIPLLQEEVYLRVTFDFREMMDIAEFYYSLDGEHWVRIGEPLQMTYRLSHFVGYRFALFNYATKETGGKVYYDYFRYLGD